MPEVIQTIVYQLNELDKAAKDKARSWYRETGFDHDWFEFVYEDFERICAILGVELGTSPVRLYGGGTRQKPRIYFSGFSSQGDGACFAGRYAYGKRSLGEIRAYAPKDAELHRIAACLHTVQRRNFYQIHATMSHRGHYYHEHSMMVAVERDSPSFQGVSNADEAEVIEALRDLARWLYRALECEYDYQSSDECVDEMISANAYSFTQSGRRFG